MVDVLVFLCVPLIFPYFFLYSVPCFSHPNTGRFLLRQLGHQMRHRAHGIFPAAIARVRRRLGPEVCWLSRRCLIMCVCVYHIHYVYIYIYIWVYIGTMYMLGILYVYYMHISMCRRCIGDVDKMYVIFYIIYIYIYDDDISHIWWISIYEYHKWCGYHNIISVCNHPPWRLGTVRSGKRTSTMASSSMPNFCLKYCLVNLGISWPSEN